MQRDTPEPQSEETEQIQIQRLCEHNTNEAETILKVVETKKTKKIDATIQKGIKENRELF